MNDIGDVAEVLGPDVRCENDQRASHIAVRVAELMNRSARSMHPFARREVSGHPIDSVPKPALQHIDALFVMRVAMRRRNLRAGRHRQFEYTHPTRSGSIDQVLDVQLTQLDRFAWSYAVKSHFQSPAN